MKSKARRSGTQNEAKRVGIWIRVSTEDQVKGESPETHEKRARLYAESKGWNVVEVYRLDAVSGKTVKETPEAKRMLEDIKEGHISGLIFSKLARLARNTKELLEFADEFRESDADLISLAESIDTSTPAGRLFYTMIAALSQWEREEIADRVAASVPIRAKEGRPTGGQAVFGYQWKDKKFVIDPKEAPVRKLVYELFQEHKRKKVVARLLNQMGHRTRGGGGFTDTTIDRLIRDTTAKGLRRANYTRNDTANSNGAWILKPESEWVVTAVDPIVSQELWEECNGYLEAQSLRLKRPTTRPVVHLFSGVAFCTCGRKMYVPSNSPKYTCQKCRTRMPIEDLEEVFHEQIRNFLFSDSEITDQISRVNGTIKEKTEMLRLLENEQLKVSGDIDKLYDLYQSGMIDKIGFWRRNKPLAERRDQLDDQLPQVQAEIDALTISHLSREQAISEARDLHSRWPKLPKEEKRRIVEAIVEKITIGDDEVEIKLYYAPPPPKSSGGNSPAGNSSEDESSLSFPAGNRGKKATPSHGFIAVTN